MIARVLQVLQQLPGDAACDATGGAAGGTAGDAAGDADATRAQYEHLAVSVAARARALRSTSAVLISVEQAR